MIQRSYSRFFTSSRQTKWTSFSGDRKAICIVNGPKGAVDIDEIYFPAAYHQYHFRKMKPLLRLEYSAAQNPAQFADMIRLVRGSLASSVRSVNSRTAFPCSAVRLLAEKLGHDCEYCEEVYQQCHKSG